MGLLMTVEAGQVVTVSSKTTPRNPALPGEMRVDVHEYPDPNNPNLKPVTQLRGGVTWNDSRDSNRRREYLVGAGHYLPDGTLDPQSPRFHEPRNVPANVRTGLFMAQPIGQVWDIAVRMEANPPEDLDAKLRDAGEKLIRSWV